MYITKHSAYKWLEGLIGKPLYYGVKSPDLDLYDFGFGQIHQIKDSYGSRERCDYTLHITCPFKLIWRNGTRCVEEYYADTPCEKFHTSVKNLTGLCVQRIEISSKNDLWLDFGDYWIVFITFENGKESWRAFNIADKTEHLVSSDMWISLR